MCVFVCLYVEPVSRCPIWKKIGCLGSACAPVSPSVLKYAIYMLLGGLLFFEDVAYIPGGS